jgi:hypothetical protein
MKTCSLLESEIPPRLTGRLERPNGVRGSWGDAAAAP